MVDVTTPVSDGFAIGLRINDRLVGLNHIVDGNGQEVFTSLLTKVDTLLAQGTEIYTLADNVTLAAGASTEWVTVPRGAYYYFDAAFTGSSPSLTLQRRGIDGLSANDAEVRTVSGADNDPIGIPNQSQMRVKNSGAGNLTGVYARLS